jgi:hypothetical protein
MKSFMPQKMLEQSVSISQHLNSQSFLESLPALPLPFLSVAVPIVTTPVSKAPNSTPAILGTPWGYGSRIGSKKSTKIVEPSEKPCPGAQIITALCTVAKTWRRDLGKKRRFLYK